MIGDPPSPPEGDPSTARSLEALRARHAELAEAPSADRAHALALTETAGRLSLLGHPPRALEAEQRAALETAVRAGLGLERLGEEAALLVELLDERDDEVEAASAGEDEAVVREAMRARDRAEWIVEGVKCLLGADAAIGEDELVALETFDETVRQELARLTRFNHVRAEGLATASSAERRRFRWRTEGAGIDPGAWEAMSAVAALVARSPEAEARFAALVLAERALHA